MSLCRAQHYDLVIVGAGMVGASLACILDKTLLTTPLHILLVETAPIDLNAPPTQPSFDARSTVLSHGTVAYLRELGLWEALADRAEAITHIHVSDQGRFGAVRMNAREQGVDALGHVIENSLLGSMFNHALARISHQPPAVAAPGYALATDAGEKCGLANAVHLEICSAVNVTAIKPLPSGMQVTLEGRAGESVLTTGLVVLAEGGRSGLCEKLGIHRSKKAYNQEAVIANVAFTEPHANIAYERFTPNGPLALLPLPDMEGQHRAALVWTRKAGEAEALKALPDAEFLAALQDEFGSRLGRFIRTGERHSYPLSLVSAEEQVRPGLVLLGNVAHSLHPVAGQGFNLAFRDTMRLAAVLTKAHNCGEPLGATEHLQGYLQVTRTDQDRTTVFSDYMTRLFSTNNAIAVWIRKFGLFSIDMVLPLRRVFGGRAMGLAGPRVQLETSVFPDQSQAP
jgi:2-octaprenyl-6-methoxyphenol hydroxylase